MRTWATDEEVIAYLLVKYEVGKSERAGIHDAIQNEDSEPLAIVCDWLNIGKSELKDARQAAGLTHAMLIW